MKIAILGANFNIMCGYTGGRFTFMGAGVVVIHNVPDHVLMVGNQEEIKGWMCRCVLWIYFDDEMVLCDVYSLKYRKSENRIQAGNGGLNNG